MKNLSTKQIINIVLIILMLIFAAQNIGSVRLRFLFFGFDLPLIILIAFVFLIGYVTAKLFRKKTKQPEVPQVNKTEEIKPNVTPENTADI